MSQWIPLHVHSQYSILDATASVEEIAQAAAAMGMPAVALTDHGNMYGVVDFYKACKEAKVKPLIGCEVYVAPENRLEKKKGEGGRAAFHLGLIAKNQTGYHNLCQLTSAGFLEGFYFHPRIDPGLLEKHAEGLICLSGCMSSRLSYEILQNNEPGIATLIHWYLKVFKEDFYLEVQSHQMREEDIVADGLRNETWLIQQYEDYIAKQQKLNTRILVLGKEYGIKVVATNDSHYMKRDDWRAHEILLNIQSGEPTETWERDAQGQPKFRTPNPKRRTYSSHECYFKSPAQMEALFSAHPEVVRNTLEIADKCSLELDFKTKHYPIYIPPSIENTTYTKEEQVKAVEDYLWTLCREGIPLRYTPERLAKVAELFPGRDPMEVVLSRLQLELDVIIPKGMADYLLIVWDFINWAKRSGIPMGPGRGSGAGSIVLYLIGVTDIEPLRFHLFFERFINPERISYPDIDVDICMDRRDDVIQYTLKKYGKDNVAQIITFGTMKAKMAIKDVGRVLSVPLSKVNEIAKLVPDELNITLEEALAKDPDLKRLSETDDETGRVLEMAQILEGCIRNTGIHAAGIIISGEPLTHHIPICTSKDAAMPVTQYSMKPVEAVGMLKVDFLGLKTLTAIQQTCEAITASTGKTIDWIDLPLDDVPTFALLNQGKTSGVFQLESSGMQDLSRNLHLDRFEEIIAVGALYRPGPMDMIPSFIARKHKREPIEYDHPWMEGILAETYGIMVYQEQVMQIAQKLANYSLGEGDVLRRAMGKKDAAQMAKERQKFIKGCGENGITETNAIQIFDKMEKFASYGFNKSPAAAYGYLSYVTGYLKANYPKEWMAALMTCDSHDITKVSKLIRESQTMNIAILPPDVNESRAPFTATPNGIRFALAGIKGIGEAVVEAILAERQKRGKYTDLYQFLKRNDTKKVGKKAVEGLIEAGCFDFTGWSRDALRLSLDPMYEAVSAHQKESAAGVISLFASIGDPDEKRFAAAPKVFQPTSRTDLLLKEKQLLGFFLTGHPLETNRDILKRLSCVPLGEVYEFPHDHVFRSAFIVETVQVKISAKTQKKFAILTISDGYDSFELPIWSELFEEKHPLLRENQLLYAVLQVDKKEEKPKISCRWLDNLTQANERMIEACDQAFDKAKAQAARFALAKKREPMKTKEDNSSPKPSKVVIRLNADKARLTHVLELKALLDAHRGSLPIECVFETGQHKYATLHIDTRMGVDPKEAFLKQLRQHPIVVDVIT